MSLKDLFKKYKLSELRLEFNEETRKYELYFCDVFGRKKIPYNKLDKEAQKYIDFKNQSLIDNPSIIDEEISKKEYERKVEKREQELKKMGYLCSSLCVLSDVPVSINNQFSKQLDNMLNEENVLYGIHRPGHINEETLIDVLENGVVITGHGNISKEAISLEQNVGYYPDNMQIKQELLCAHGWKGSNGSFLIRIPDEELKKDKLFNEPKDNFKRLKPEYIVGFVPFTKLPNGSLIIDRIITLEDIKKYKAQQKKQEVKQEIHYTYEPNNVEIIEEKCRTR